VLLVAAQPDRPVPPLRSGALGRLGAAEPGTDDHQSVVTHLRTSLGSDVDSSGDYPTDPRPNRERAMSSLSTRCRADAMIPACIDAS
jgi:hypothetical protein